MGAKTGGQVARAFEGLGADSISEREATIRKQQEMQEEEAKKQRIRLLRARGGSLLEGLTESKGALLGE